MSDIMQHTLICKNNQIELELINYIIFLNVNLESIDMKFDNKLYYPVSGATVLYRDFNILGNRMFVNLNEMNGYSLSLIEIPSKHMVIIIKGEPSEIIMENTRLCFTLSITT